MDELFSSLALQTVQLVGKAAFGAAGTLALKRVTDYVGHAQHAPEPQAKLERLLSRFEARLRIVTPAIDLVEIIAARGHSTLAGALHLTHALRRDILSLGASLPLSPRRPDSTPMEASLVGELQALLDKIDDTVPLLNLALTTSGAHLGGSLPEGISPARLMQASSMLASAREGSMVGAPFVLRLYSLFGASVRPKSRHDFTWKEEFVKCRLCLWRLDRCLAYELRILEDTDDGRYHAEEERPQAAEWASAMGSIGVGGRSIVVPLERVATLYYTSAGSLLNIEDSTSPVLVLSVKSEQADPLSDMAEFGKLNDNVCWYALEIAATDPDSSESDSSESDSSESDSDGDSSADISEEDEELAHTFDQLCAVSPATDDDGDDGDDGDDDDGDDDDGDNIEEQQAVEEKESDIEEGESRPPSLASHLLQPLEFLAHEWNMSTLSLLEYMIRLACVEMSEQVSHLEVPDEKLRLYLDATRAREGAVPDSRKSTVTVSTLGTPR
ncbi:Ran-specific GTPase-activating protein 30 [Coemansia sp. RSA 2050]|nr:Ran-specific GTPase-activating protein 30 [Coemansia sp. RSA 2050]